MGGRRPITCVTAGLRDRRATSVTVDITQRFAEAHFPKSAEDLCLRLTMQTVLAHMDVPGLPFRRCSGGRPWIGCERKTIGVTPEDLYAGENRFRLFSRRRAHCLLRRRRGPVYGIAGASVGRNPPRLPIIDWTLNQQRWVRLGLMFL